MYLVSATTYINIIFHVALIMFTVPYFIGEKKEKFYNSEFKAFNNFTVSEVLVYSDHLNTTLNLFT